MPRDGSGIYTKPFPDVVTGTTIQSTVHNGTISDVAQDLNTPRPIVAGGTGANNARDAMTSLQGDVAYQVVTNYDAYAFVSGSFYSAAGATSAPTGNAFIGQCYTSDPAVVPPAVPAGQNMFIEARDVTTGSNYIRQKTAGVWGTWTLLAGSVTALDAAYVNVTGDVMTGVLTISGTNGCAVGGPLIAGNANAASGSLYFGNNGTKQFSCDGTTFSINGGPLNVGGRITATNDIISYNGSGAGGAYFFGNSGTKLLNYDGTNFNLVGGALSVIGDVYASRFFSQTAGSPTTGIYFFGNTNTKYLQYDGTNFNLVGGNLTVPGHVTRTGTFGTFGGNSFNIFHGTGQQLWIDSTNVGTFAYTSDYRIKKDVIDLPGMWDTVKALRPIKYTQAQFSPPSHVKYVAEETLKARKEAEENPQAKPREVNTAPLFAADDIERWGFIAHELQETLTPSASTGEKDSPDTIQSPNPFTLIAALTKALQEAMARIEALEAA
jgi:hypothetical protein